MSACPHARGGQVYTEVQSRQPWVCGHRDIVHTATSNLTWRCCFTATGEWTWKSSPCCHRFVDMQQQSTLTVFFGHVDMTVQSLQPRTFRLMDNEVHYYIAIDMWTCGYGCAFPYHHGNKDMSTLTCSPHIQGYVDMPVQTT